MTTTIRDIARQAGVSITTVSHVINKTRFVSAELCTRVEQAIEKLGYQPSFLGRGLRKGKSNTIGLILPDYGNPFFLRVARGINEQVQRHNYSLITCNTDEDPRQEEFYIKLLQQQRVDGFVIASTLPDNNKTLISLTNSHIPLVLIDRYYKKLQVDQVFSDNEAGTYRAIVYLVKLGHKAIGLLEGIPSLRPIKDRAAGYRRALQEHGIEENEKLIAQGYSQIEEGDTATEYLINNTNITAIFSTNNMMTLGALCYFKAKRIKCPEDISLIGFDDADWTTAFTPSLSVVAQQAYDMGYRASELLFRAIAKNGERPKPLHIKLDTALLIRESTATVTKNPTAGGDKGEY